MPSLANFLTPTNRSQFSFQASGVPDDTFSVKEFVGSEHALSEDYRFTLTLQAEGVLAPAQLVGQKGVLKIVWGSERVFVHGVLSDFHYAGAFSGGHEYRAMLTSPLFPLTLSRHNRVFLNKTVVQMVEEVLLSAGLAAGDFQSRTGQQYPVREYCVQYDESDYAFIRRQLAHYGLFFRFEPTPDKALLVFHDGVENLPGLFDAGQLLYQEQSGTNRGLEAIFAFRPRARMLPEQVVLKDYNYRTPEIALGAQGARQASVAGQGGETRYGEHFKDMTEGQTLARIRQQALDWQRETFVAESDCRGIAPGLRFTMIGHPEERYNGEYLVVEAEHQGDQGAAFAMGDKAKAMSYRNRMLLIRAGVHFRKPLPEPRPVHGIFTARVESTGGEYAHLDEYGRYRVRADFDLGSAGDGQASHPVRLMQPYGGNNFGLHLPLHAGTEVAMSCVNGDLDRPILLGVLPNPATASPVGAANHSQNVLRSKAGNELVMEDRKGKEKTELFTLGRKNILSLDADSEGHQVRLATEEGEMEVFAAKTLLIESGDSQTLQSGRDHLVTVENAQRLLTKHGQIELQAATDLQLKAGEHLLLQAEKAQMTLTAGRNMASEVGQSFSAEVLSDDLQLLANQGKIDIRVAKGITLAGRGGGKIHIGQGSGAIEITTGGDLTINAPSVTINAGTINIRSGSISNN